MSRDQISLSLKNISALHAKFWKDQKTMQESEPSKSEDDNRGDPGKMKKTIDELLQKVVKSKWKNHGATRPFSDDVVASWMTIEVSGRYLLFKCLRSFVKLI